jgi:hypothetical protein
MQSSNDIRAHSLLSVIDPLFPTTLPIWLTLPKRIHPIGELEAKENDRRQREREPKIIIILASMQCTLCTVFSRPF